MKKDTKLPKSRLFFSASAHARLMELKEIKKSVKTKTSKTTKTTKKRH